MPDSERIDRRTAMERAALTVLAGAGLAACSAPQAIAAVPRALPAGTLPQDRRLGPLLDFNGYFPFTPSENREAWARRAEYVRRQIQLASGLWPMPARSALEPVVHGRVDRDTYTVERVSLQSSPGLYVTGSLYRPKNRTGRLPAILCPHGHWARGRFHDHGPDRALQEVTAGAEQFPVAGRYPLQARCVHLARMGCVVFHYDMLGYADNRPIGYELAHRFNVQRQDFSSPEHWGLFSAQAELRLFNILGLQTWNSVRALDWVLTLPEVDAERIGVTGASGGGTQTFLLTAIDERIKASFPAVMVSTAMQGGCTCENACYLRINTGNIEFAAMSAPRPIAMSAANDWTRELETKGLPELRQHFAMMGVPENVSGQHFNFPHNYNYVSRRYMYEFFHRHFRLEGERAPEELTFVPLSEQEMTVWDAQHPAPAADDAAEVALLQRLDAENQRQLAALTPRDEATLAEFRRVIGGAYDVMIGRTLPAAADVQFEKKAEVPRDGFAEFTGLLRTPRFGEEFPVVFLHPTNWNGRVVVWVHEQGKAGLFEASGELRPEVLRVVRSGTGVCSADLYQQGEFLADGQTPTESRVVENPRQFAGFTWGFNHPLVAQRTHDLLSLITFIRHHEDRPRQVAIFAQGAVTPYAAAAFAQAGAAVDRLALGTSGFRFGQVTSIRDVRFWPGAVKYGDLPGLLALAAPRSLWLAGEGAEAPALLAAAYRAAGQPSKLTLSNAESAEAVRDAALAWLQS